MTRVKLAMIPSLALVTTPLLAFLSSASVLYIGNQAELHHQREVLLPFLAVFAITWSVGAVLFLLASRPLFRFMSWGYFLSAPAIVLYRFVMGLTEDHPALGALGVGWLVDSGPGLLLCCAGLLTFSALLARQWEPHVITAPLAALGVLLLLHDASIFFSDVERRDVSHDEAAVAPSSLPEAPNVYHIVLDAFQTEVFEKLRAEDDALDAALGGFAYFSENRALYHSTLLSLGSMFTGQRYAYDRTLADFIEAAFGEASFVARLAAKGFRTVAVVPVSDPFEKTLFDRLSHHADRVERSAAVNTVGFRNLWIVANVPRPVRDWLLSSSWLSEQTRQELRLTMAGRALTDSDPVASHSSFLELVREEKALPASGRYTFVHLLIPHTPYVLRADCSYRAGAVRDTHPLEQTRCTLDLLTRFLDHLHDLDRFDSALILVHGDHGDPFRLRGDALVPARARSLATPLLVKRPGRRREDDFEACATPSTLLDIAPSLLEWLEIEPDPSFEGTSLAASCLDPLDQ